MKYLYGMCSQLRFTLHRKKLWLEDSQVLEVGDTIVMEHATTRVLKRKGGSCLRVYFGKSENDVTLDTDGDYCLCTSFGGSRVVMQYTFLPESKDPVKHELLRRRVPLDCLCRFRQPCAFTSLEPFGLEEYTDGEQVKRAGVAVILRANYAVYTLNGEIEAVYVWGDSSEEQAKRIAKALDALGFPVVN